ncbi:MAG: NAD-dependent epimerase/dehydratase family protein [Thermomicrobiales bacterium]
MRVLVTGGSGHIGKYVAGDLLDHGHEVVSVDRRPLTRDQVQPQQGLRFREGDTTNVGHMAGAMAGCDAVIHLGAIPAPYLHPDEVVFANNVLGTFAVLQAASLVGIKKAVIASSLSALGTAYAVRLFAPPYVPVDEDIPLLGQDCYALAKEVDERTGEMFHRRVGMQVLAYRFSWVAHADDIKNMTAKIARDPRHDNWWRLLWSYVDVRDAAAACRLGIEVDGLGFEVFNITASDTLSNAPTEELVRQYCPDTEIRSPITGTESAFSIAKARRLLGYEPHHGWR